MPVRGARETSGALRELARYVGTPLTAASRFALQPTLTTAKRNVRSIPFEDSTGALEASLTIRKKGGGSGLNITTQVGPSAGFQRFAGTSAGKFGFRQPARYAHLLEFGTVHFAPKPFLTPAFLNTQGQVVKRFGDRIGTEMEKRAAKLRKR